MGFLVILGAWLAGFLVVPSEFLEADENRPRAEGGASTRPSVKSEEMNPREKLQNGPE